MKKYYLLLIVSLSVGAFSYIKHTRIDEKKPAKLIQKKSLIPELYSKSVIAGGKDRKKEKKISRDKFIKDIKVDKKTKILEIGPYHSPVLLGSNIYYFDVFTKEQLIERAKKDPYVTDHSKIPEIQYVSPNADMGIIDAKFDIVFSSHNIEHQIDLVDHLQKVSNILRENGKYYLAIPDKRYCFDHYIPETSMADVLAAFYEKRKIHDLRTILSMRCETTHNEPLRHHNFDSGETNGVKNVKCYEKALKEFKDSKGSYIDSHSWRFTPTNFNYIIESLYKLGYISFRVEKVYETATNSHEFFAILRKV